MIYFPLAVAIFFSLVSSGTAYRLYQAQQRETETQFKHDQQIGALCAELATELSYRQALEATNRDLLSKNNHAKETLQRFRGDLQQILE